MRIVRFDIWSWHHTLFNRVEKVDWMPIKRKANPKFIPDNISGGQIGT